MFHVTIKQATKTTKARVSPVTEDQLVSSKPFAVNSKTFLLESCQHGGWTKVYESSRPPLLLDRPVQKVLNESCLRYLSTYQGRREASIHLLGKKSKVPIVIDKVDGTYLFPTTGHLKPNCMWIALFHIYSLTEEGPKQTRVCFSDGQKVLVPVSKKSLFSRMMLTLELHEKANQKKGVLQSGKTSYYGIGAKTVSFFVPPQKE